MACEALENPVFIGGYTMIQAIYVLIRCVVVSTVSGYIIPVLASNACCIFFLFCFLGEDRTHLLGRVCLCARMPEVSFVARMCVCMCARARSCISRMQKPT